MAAVNQKDPPRHLWYLDELTSAYESRADEDAGLDGLAAELRAGLEELRRLVRAEGGARPVSA